MKRLIITQMGGPKNLDEVHPFLRRIFLDRELVKLPLQPILGRFLAFLRKKRTIEHYRLIGGGSTTCDITTRIAKKLEYRFDGEFRVEAQFTHISPFLEYDENSIIFPLYPHYSKVMIEPIKKMGGGMVVDNWFSNCKYVDCMGEIIGREMEGLVPTNTILLFVAHSIPEVCVGSKEPYIDNIEENFRILSRKFPKFESRLCYIGQVGTRGWVGPSCLELSEKLKDRCVVVVYLSLPVDNVEVLYDIDIELKTNMKKCGISNFVRVPMLNDSPNFIEAIVDIVRNKI